MNQKKVSKPTFKKVDIEQKIKEQEAEEQQEEEKVKDINSMSNEELEALLAEKQETLANKKEKVVLKKFPPKAAKKKVRRRQTSGPVVPIEQWKPILEKFFSNENVDIHHTPNGDIDRIDVTPKAELGEKDWRICALAFLGSEFNITLYYDMQPGFNIKSIKLEAMPFTHLEKCLEFVYSNRHVFIETHEPEEEI